MGKINSLSRAHKSPIYESKRLFSPSFYSAHLVFHETFINFNTFFAIFHIINNDSLPDADTPFILFCIREACGKINTIMDTNAIRRTVSCTDMADCLIQSESGPTRIELNNDTSVIPPNRLKTESKPTDFGS